MQIQTRTVEDLAEVLRETNAGCSLLIGAGCSRSAGIPLASEFVKIIQEKHQRAYARAADPKEYPQCMAQLDHGLRRDLIAGYVDKASLNWAHIGIARLFQAGHVARILTTNFDPLVVRSCGLLGEFPAVYDLAVSGQFKPADIPEKAVLYLHGQHTGFVLLNTEEETKRHAARLASIFDDAMRRRVWIVVGYSGASDPIVEDLLAKVPRFDYGLYWVTYKDSMPPASVQEKLLSISEKNAYLIKGEDADSFFIKLTQSMGEFPPEIIDKPFSVLASQLRKLPPYPVSGGVGQDVTGIQLQRIEKAIQRYEREALPEEAGTGSLQVSREMLDSITVAAQRLLVAGDHDGALKLRWAWEKSRDEKLGDVLVGAAIGEMQDIVQKAEGLSPVKAPNLYAEAKSLYRAAREIGGQRSDLMVAFGVVLLALAERSHGAGRKKLLKEAAAQFEAANPRPGDDSWNDWCIAVYGLAEVSDHDAAAPLYSAAAAKWEQAAAFTPQDYVSIYNCAVATYRASQLKEGKPAEELLVKAITQYRSALALEPDDPDVMAALGLALIASAKFVKGDEAASRQAEGQKFLRGAEAAPAEIGAHNIACAHALLGHPEQCRIWLERSLEQKRYHREKALRDPNLLSVRDLEWFKDLVNSPRGLTNAT